MVDKQLCAIAQEEEEHQNRDVEHRAVGDGEGGLRAEGEQGDERDVEQELRDIEAAQHQSRRAIVLRDGGVAAALLSRPQVEGAGWRGEDGVFGVDEHLGVLLGGRLVDEEVVVTHGGGVM